MKTATKHTARTAIEKVHAATVTATQAIRTPGKLAIGDAIHQGDVYIHRVKNDHPRGAELGTRQVAVGTTVGSRHIVEGNAVKVYAGKKYPGGFKEPEGCAPGALLGPVVVGPCVLTHPEHAHHRLEDGTYQVTYQFDARTMSAVQD